MKKSHLLFLSALLFAVALPMHGQGINPGGCVQSPENPTVVLALLGSAGAFAVTAKDRIKAFRASRKK